MHFCVHLSSGGERERERERAARPQPAESVRMKAISSKLFIFAWAAVAAAAAIVYLQGECATPAAIVNAIILIKSPLHCHRPTH